jgi:hypothetical protein
VVGFLDGRIHIEYALTCAILAPWSSHARLIDRVLWFDVRVAHVAPDSVQDIRAQRKRERISTGE